MEERRRSRRTEMSSTLMVKRLDQGDMQEVSIDIVDVSPNGVGFLCKEVLSIGAVYESKLRIWTHEVLHAFLQIVRIEMKGDSYTYGAVFIGMSESDAARIRVYQTINDDEKTIRKKIAVSVVAAILLVLLYLLIFRFFLVRTVRNQAH